ncbi:MAG: tryptophan synthase subunit alpha [Chitinophagia bacterium]|nr:tryptophan synthase subunit alpha [Chitinophagia bacterium]
MGRLHELFARKNRDVLNVYITAGFPKMDSTITVMEALQSSGADLIELGMPYSDPLADGPVIQESSLQALANGMTIEKLFEQLKGFRNKIDVPVVLMGYMNPVLQFGFEKFCETAASVGVDGLILPDLPAFEFESHYGEIIQKNGLDFIFLVTPETSEERVRKLDALSSGFLYAVSSSSTTGKEKDFNAVVNYLKRLEGYGLKNPILVGFGIKDRETFEAVTPYAAGAIIGSAFIKAVSEGEDPVKTTIAFVKNVLNK